MTDGATPPLSLTIPTMSNDKCAEGYYCDGVGGGAKWPTDTVKYCKQGEKCPLGSETATACPAGTFQFNKVQPDCLKCPPGYFCDVQSELVHTTFVDNKKCPAGYYCLESTDNKNKTPCPPGTYNPNQGARILSECIPAPPGYFIAAKGKDKVDPNDKCTAGYYCALGSWTATPDEALWADASY